MKSTSMPFEILTWTFALCLMCSSIVLADSWISPRSRTITSSTGSFLIRLEPGSHWKGGGDQNVNCKAIMFKYDPTDGNYVRQTNFFLENQVAPADALISDDGKYLITFDNHFSIGYGNVIVLYDLVTAKKTHFQLENFIPESEIEKLPHSTSSIHWRSHVNFMLDERFVYIQGAHDLSNPLKEYPSYIMDLKTKTVKIDTRK